jgi:hypothetical protein
LAQRRPGGCPLNSPGAHADVSNGGDNRGGGFGIGAQRFTSRLIELGKQLAEGLTAKGWSVVDTQARRILVLEVLHDPMCKLDPGFGPYHVLVNGKPVERMIRFEMAVANAYGKDKQLTPPTFTINQYAPILQVDHSSS